MRREADILCSKIVFFYFCAADTTFLPHKLNLESGYGNHRDFFFAKFFLRVGRVTGNTEFFFYRPNGKFSYVV